MPGLGFDKSGNRLGRGKGFYDTYLERCMKHPKGKPYTIALAFREQLCQEIPVDERDIHIDEVLYEDQWSAHEVLESHRVLVLIWWDHQSAF